MASNFPTSLDSFTNPLSGDKLDSPSHSTQHADANDAIEGLETKIGIGASPAGSATAGYAFVHSSGGTTAWSQVGYEGITSGTATSGQVLAANGSGAVSWSTPVVDNTAWTSWTPTITAGSGSITTKSTNYAKYKQIGKTVLLKFSILITDNGTGAGDVQLTLPITAISGDLSVGSGRNTSNGNMLQIRCTSTTGLSINRYDNVYPVASGQTLVGSLVYEAA